MGFGIKNAYAGPLRISIYWKKRICEEHRHMPEKKKNSTTTHDDILDSIPLTEADITDQDDDYEEPEDYVVSDGKNIQKIKRHNKRGREEDWE